jgi:hypothetical protein
MPEVKSIQNWVPGTRPLIYPEDIGGYRLTRQGAIVTQMHYASTPTASEDRGEFRIYYSKTKPKRMVMEEVIGSLGSFPVTPEIRIPADSIKWFSAKAEIPKDISLIDICPHMHLIGKHFVAYAISPKGDTINLLRIPHWDFKLQYAYKFKKILKIEKGSTIHIKASFDNTASNPRNPFNPPQMIRTANDDENMNSTHEMLNLGLRFMDYQPGDENISLE